MRAFTARCYDELITSLVAYDQDMTDILRNGGALTQEQYTRYMQMICGASMMRVDGHYEQANKILYNIKMLLHDIYKQKML